MRYINTMLRQVVIIYYFTKSSRLTLAKTTSVRTKLSLATCHTALLSHKTSKYNMLSNAPKSPEINNLFSLNFFKIQS